MIWRGSNEPDAEPPGSRGRSRHPSPGPRRTVGNRVESVLDAAERAAVGIREDAQEWARRYLEESRRKADEVAAERIQEISALTDSLIARARAVAQQSDELIAALDDAGRRVLNNARPGSARRPRRPRGNEAPPQHAGNAMPPGRRRPVARRLRSARPPPAGRQAQPPPRGPARAAARSRGPAAAAAAACSAPPQQPPAASARASRRPRQGRRRGATAQPRRRPRPHRRRPRRRRLPAAPADEPPPQSPRVSEGARLLATQMAVAGSTRDEIAWRLREEFGIQDASAILDEIGI